MSLKVDLKARNDVDTLGVHLMQNAEVAGKLANLVSVCEEKMETNPAKESLPERLVSIFSLINQQNERSKTLESRISQVEDAVRPKYQCQFRYSLTSIESSQKKALKILEPLFDAQCGSIESQFKEAISRLNNYRKNPSLIQLMLLEKDVDHFSLRLIDLNALSQSVLPSEKMLTRMNKLENGCRNLSRVIATQKPGEKGHLLMQLRGLCKHPNVFDREFLEDIYNRLDAMIGGLDSQVENELHDMIRRHVADGDDKDDRWCAIHRYDDICFFATAFKTVFADLLEKTLKDDLTPEELSRYYSLMFETIFGPDDQDPVEWVKWELPALFEISEEVFKKILMERNLNLSADTSVSTPESILERKQNLSADSSVSTPESISSSDDDDDEPSEGSSIDRSEQDIQFESPRSIPSPKRKITSNTQFSNLLGKLYVIQHEAQESNASVDKGLIKDAIEGTLSDDLRRSLYEMISLKASDKKYKEKRWGEVHCADDISRLYQAIGALKT